MNYEALWQRLGLSIDWRYTYRTIDELSRRTSQLSFLDLYCKGLVYRHEAPAIWCPECCTAIAQAELNDLERESEFVTLAFRLEDGSTLSIATTRPELLPACVAVFVNPNDTRYQRLIGRCVKEPLFGQEIPLLADPEADPTKGTGAVMCCTFGDTTDVEWWYKHHLPLKITIGRDGRLTREAGDFFGLTTREARSRIVETLEERGLVLVRLPATQSVRVHERCDTPVEYIVTQQWFVRVPYVTEEVYQTLFTAAEGKSSIHNARWPVADEALIDEGSEAVGDAIVEVATAIRRYKSEANLSLGTELQQLQLTTSQPSLARLLRDATADITSVTRARKVEVSERLDADLEIVKTDGAIAVALARRVSVIQPTR